MQVFIVGSPYETAESLDPRRLWKQILECDQIIAAIEGKSAWSKHPVILMYKNNVDWLKLYRTTLGLYKAGCLEDAKKCSDIAELIKPSFICDNLIKQMKRRLYTKDKNYYNQWSELGESNINYYFVDNQWLLYENGKLIQKI